MHASTPFASSRFSNHGEVFCYVQLSLADTPGLSRADKLQSLERTIHGALRMSRQGALVGGGTGRDYVYLDVVLEDWQRGVSALCWYLRSASVGPRSWIRFFDATLRDEWVGVHPDTPAPD